MCMIVWFIFCVPYLQNVYDCMVYFLCALISKCVCLYGLFPVCLICKMCMIVWFIFCVPYYQNVYDCKVYFLYALFSKCV